MFQEAGGRLLLFWREGSVSGGRGASPARRKGGMQGRAYGADGGVLPRRRARGNEYVYAKKHKSIYEKGMRQAHPSS